MMALRWPTLGIKPIGYHVMVFQIEKQNIFVHAVSSPFLLAFKFTGHITLYLFVFKKANREQ